MEYLSNVDSRVWTSLFVVLVLYGLRIPARSLIHRFVQSIRTRIAWQQTVNAVLLAIALPALILTWFDEFNSVLTMFSLVAAGFTVVCKEPILNVFGYLVILWRAVFAIGDRIQIGAVTGDVISQGLMYILIAEVGNWTRADLHTGRTVKVPNNKVFTETVANFSRGLPVIWEELSFTFDGTAAPQEIKALGRELVDQFGYHLTVHDRVTLSRAPEEMMFAHPEPMVYLTPHEGKFTLRLRFLCKFHKRWSVGQDLTDVLLDRVAGKDELKLA